MPGELTFEEAGHVYRVDGQAWPSVTQILDPLNELDGIPRAVLEAARVFGGHVHVGCHLLNQDALDWGALDPALLPYVTGWQNFLNESGAIVLASEERVLHRTLRYAGTLDVRALWKERMCFIDIKSGAVPRTVGLQCAGYAQAWCHMHDDARPARHRRYCVQLTGKSLGYKVHALNDTNDFTFFNSALNIHNFRNQRNAA